MSDAELENLIAEVEEASCMDAFGPDTFIPLLKELATLREVAEAARDAYNLAGWHCDEYADPMNTSPEDNVAHINGLIRQTLSKALDRLDALKGGKP